MRTEVLVLAVRQRLPLVAVHNQVVLIHVAQTLFAQGIGHIIEGVGIERSRGRERTTVAATQTDIGAEGERGYTVDIPLQVHVSCPVVIARIALTDAVREGTASGVDEVLRSRSVPVVGIIAGPGNTSANPQISCLLVADIQCRCLRFSLSLVITTTSTTTTREVSVVHVVGITHEGIAHITKRLHGGKTNTIAVICTVAHIGVHLQAVTRATLGFKLQHEVVITIIDIGHPRQVALLIIGFYLVNHVRRKVLHHRIVVSCHEVTTVEFEPPHLLTIDRYTAVIIDLGARQHLYQRLNNRSFRHTESIGVIYQRIIFHHHLGDIGQHHGLIEHHGITLHSDLSQSQCTTVYLCKLTVYHLVAQIADAQQVVTGTQGIEHKTSVLVGISAIDIGGVLLTIL